MSTKRLILFYALFVVQIILAQNNTSDLCVLAVNKAGDKFFSDKTKKNALYAVNLKISNAYDIKPNGVELDWHKLLASSQNVFTKNSGYIPLVKLKDVNMLMRNIINNNNLGSKPKINLVLYQISDNTPASSLKQILKSNFQEGKDILEVLTGKKWDISIESPVLKTTPKGYLTSIAVISQYKKLLAVAEEYQNSLGANFSGFKFTNAIPGNYVLQAREIEYDIKKGEITRTINTENWKTKKRSTSESYPQYNVDRQFNFQRQQLSDNEFTLLKDFDKKSQLSTGLQICGDVLNPGAVFTRAAGINWTNYFSWSNTCPVDSEADLKISGNPRLLDGGYITSRATSPGNYHDQESDGVVGDFNGDGVMDQVHVSGNSIMLTYYDGKGFKSVEQPTIWFPIPAHNDSKIVVLDFNGDGLQDILFPLEDGRVVSFRSEGNRFDNPRIAEYVPIHGAKLFDTKSAWVVKNLLTNCDELLYLGYTNKFASYVYNKATEGLRSNSASDWLDWEHNNIQKSGFSEGSIIKLPGLTDLPSFYSILRSGYLRYYDTLINDNKTIEVRNFYLDKYITDSGYNSVTRTLNRSSRVNFFTDQDGDGYRDYVALTGGWGEYMTVYYGPQYTAKIAFRVDYHMDYDWNQFIKFQDVNGDKKNDLIYYKDNEFKVEISNGRAGMSLFGIPCSTRRTTNGRYTGTLTGISKTTNGFTSFTFPNEVQDMSLGSFLGFNHVNFNSNRATNSGGYLANAPKIYPPFANQLSFGKWNVIYDNFQSTKAYHHNEHADKIGDWSGEKEDIMLSGKFISGKEEVLLSINNKKKQNEIIEFKQNTTPEALGSYIPKTIKRNTGYMFGNSVNYDSNNKYEVIDYNNDGINELLVLPYNSKNHMIFKANNLGVWELVKSTSSWFTNITKDYKVVVGDFDGDSRKNDFFIYNSDLGLWAMFKILEDGSTSTVVHNSYSGKFGTGIYMSDFANGSTGIVAVDMITHTALMGVTGAGWLTVMSFAGGTDFTYNLCSQTIKTDAGIDLNVSNTKINRIQSFKDGAIACPLMYASDGFVYQLIRDNNGFVAVNTNPANPNEHGFADAHKTVSLKPNPNFKNAVLGMSYNGNKLNAARLCQIKANAYSNSSSRNRSNESSTIENKTLSTIFPNPATSGSSITVNNNNEIINTISVFNTTGSLIKIYDNINTENTTIVLPDLVSGIYFIKIDNTTTHKLIIK